MYGASLGLASYFFCAYLCRRRKTRPVFLKMKKCNNEKMKRIMARKQKTSVLREQQSLENRWVFDSGYRRTDHHSFVNELGLSWSVDSSD
jgi:hypothetical protein